MFCKNCGSEIADGQRFCPQCGAPVENEAPKTEPAPQPAPAPQQNYSASQPAPAPQQNYSAPQPAPAPQQNYAAPQPAPAPQQNYSAPQPAPAPQQNYGAPQPAPAPQQNYGAPQPAPAPQTAEKKKSKLPLIIIIAVALIAAAAVGIYFIKGRGPKPETTTAGEADYSGEENSSEKVTDEQGEPVSNAPVSPDAPAPGLLKGENACLLSPMTAGIYLEVLERLEREYGCCNVSENGRFMTGLMFARLMQLDEDGIPDLFVVYSEGFDYETGYDRFPKFDVYFSDDPSYPYFHGREVSNFGNDVAPGIEFGLRDGKIYIVEEDGCSVNCWFFGGDHSYENIFSYEENLETSTCLINGEEYDFSDERAAELIEGFRSDYTFERIDFFKYDDPDAFYGLENDYNSVRDNIHAAVSGVNYTIRLVPGYDVPEGTEVQDIGLHDDIYEAVSNVAVVKIDLKTKKETVLGVFSEKDYVQQFEAPHPRFVSAENNGDKWICKISFYEWNDMVLVDGKTGEIKAIMPYEQFDYYILDEDAIILKTFSFEGCGIMYVVDWDGEIIASRDGVMNCYLSNDYTLYYICEDFETDRYYVKKLSYSDLVENKVADDETTLEMGSFTYAKFDGAYLIYYVDGDEYAMNVTGYDPAEHPACVKSLSSLVGNVYSYEWGEVEYSEQGYEITPPFYSVEVLSADEENSTIDISICYGGRNASPIYEAEATVRMSGDVGAFDYEDSWLNSGSGIISFYYDGVGINVDEIFSNSVNRGTLETGYELMLDKK